MESENPFKNVEIVSGQELSNYNPNELCYLDDDEEMNNRIITTSIQIELRENQNTSTSNHTDDEECNPLYVKVEPHVKEEEETDTDGTPLLDEPDILRAANDIDDDCLSFNPESYLNIEDHSDLHNEEQFEIIEQKPIENLSPAPSSPLQINNELLNIHDHSYSQPQNPAETSFCDDIVECLLKDSKFAGDETNSTSVQLLTDFTRIMKTIVVNDEDGITPVSQYLDQMTASLHKLKVIKQELCTDQTKPEEIVIAPEFKDETKMEVKVETVQKMEVDCDPNIMEIKQEHESQSTVHIYEQPLVNGDKNLVVDENLDATVKQLLVYVEKAQNFNNTLTETNENLLKSVFVSTDDLKNGAKKFAEAIQTHVDECQNLLADICKNGNLVKEAELSISKSSSKRKDDLSGMENDSDDSIEKLCNFTNLNHSKGNKKLPNGIEKTTKVEQKKKTKKSKEDILSSDSDMDSLRSNASDVDHHSDKDDSDSDLSDEEEKFRQRLENKAKADLMKSSDEGESDEASYHTSESSIFSSDDEKPSMKEKTLAEQKQLPIEDAHNETPNEVASKDVSEEKSEKSIIPNSSIKEDKTENGGNLLQRKFPKAIRRKSYEREIFKKGFLHDSDSSLSDDERVKQNNKSTKQKKDAVITKSPQSDTKVDETNDVLDLSAFNGRHEGRSMDLGKYFEKRATQAEKNDVQPCDLTKVKQPIESPKKNPNDLKQSVSSPSSLIDDIAYISLSSESDSEISSTNAEGATTQGRRRKQLTEEELKEETKKAKKEETERVKKLEEKSGRMTQFLTQRLSQCDVIESNELVLDYSEEKDIEVKVHSRLVDRLKPHQFEGIKFMYDNCYGSIDEAKANNGSGCILAHCMGLGKTLQLITLLHTVIRFDALHTKRILVICPKSTIYNWYEEFGKWLRGIEADQGKKLVVKFLEDNVKIEQKLKVLEDWHQCQNPSVFLINYESFRILVNWSGTGRVKIPMKEEVIKKFQARIAKCLLSPGPDLVVCDEGHIIKNQKGATNKAVTKIMTKRRIILTGTPVQNALHEYYAMVQWIKPNLLGTAHEFNVIYANPIKDGQNKDSTPLEIKKMKQKSYVLNKNLSKFVQRKDASVLKEFLPIKHEYCIFVPLTKVQEKLYNYYLEANRNDHMGRSLLPHYTALRKIWTHPKVLKYAHERALKGENKFAQHQQQQQNQRGKVSKNAFAEDGEGEVPDDIFDTSQGLTAVTNDWWSSMVTQDDIDSLFASHKMRLLFEILKMCEKQGEKILIFSTFVAVLDCIEQFMKAIQNQDNNPNAVRHGYSQYKTNWVLGRDYYRLDGSTPKATRQHMINEFNRPGSSPRCFLISAKAGGQGINLISANRCIIVDTSWNPANDNQNIFRIYRLGQTKTCYVYRFVAASTMEERVYSRSVTKEAMSHRVVEKKQIERHYVKDELNELFVSYKLKSREDLPNFPKDELLRHLIINLPEAAHNFHEHDSLLENKPEDDLDEDEKKEAWQSYISESSTANRMNTALQNNINNLPPNALAKASDLLKYYPDMNMYNSPWLMGGLADATGLNSLYPMASSIFASDLFKRIGSYDPLNLYSSSSLTPSTTASTSSLISSLLHPHNPLSALGNIAPTTTASSYSANNIPPASNSIFAQPGTSGVAGTSASTTSSSALPTSLKSGKLSSETLKRLGNIGNNSLQQVSNLKKSTLSNNRKKSTDPLMVPQNSSKNLSILPDIDQPPRNIPAVVSRAPNNSSLVISSARSLNEGTSARTNIVPKKKIVNMPPAHLSTAASSSPKVNFMLNKSSSSGQPRQLLKKGTETQSKAPSERQSSYPQQIIVQKTQKPQVPPMQKLTFTNNSQQKTVLPMATHKQQPPNILKPPSSQMNVQKTPSQPSFSKVHFAPSTSNNKKTAIFNTPKQNKIVPVTTKTNLIPSSPSTAIMRQLEKNQTSLIDTSKKSGNASQKLPQISSLSPQNSVSIIKLPKSSSNTSLRSIPSQNNLAPSISLQQGASSPKTLQKIIKPQQLMQAIQQGAKRKSDVNFASAIKRIRMHKDGDNTESPVKVVELE